MATDRTESQRRPALDAAARKRAFVLAAATTCAAAGLMLAVGLPRFGAGSDPEPAPRARKVVVGGDAAAQAPPPIERAPSKAELRTVRAAAARFARAFSDGIGHRFDVAVSGIIENENFGHDGLR